MSIIDECDLADCADEFILVTYNFTCDDADDNDDTYEPEYMEYWDEDNMQEEPAPEPCEVCGFRATCKPAELVYCSDRDRNRA